MFPFKPVLHPLLAPNASFAVYAPDSAMKYVSNALAIARNLERPAFESEVLDVPGFSVENGVEILLYTPNSGPNQDRSFEPCNEGFLIVNRHSDLVLTFLF